MLGQGSEDENAIAAKVAPISQLSRSNARSALDRFEDWRVYRSLRSLRDFCRREVLDDHERSASVTELEKVGSRRSRSVCINNSAQGAGSGPCSGFGRLGSRLPGKPEYTKRLVQRSSLHA